MTPPSFALYLVHNWCTSLFPYLVFLSVSSPEVPASICNLLDVVAVSFPRFNCVPVSCFCSHKAYDCKVVRRVEGGPIAFSRFCELARPFSSALALSDACLFPGCNAQLIVSCRVGATRWLTRRTTRSAYPPMSLLSLVTVSATQRVQLAILVWVVWRILIPS